MDSNMVDRAADTGASRRQTQRAPLVGPYVWHGKDLASSPEWIRALSAADIAEVRAALADAKARGTSLPSLRRVDFPLPGLQAKLAAIGNEVEHGRGFVLLRGLPADTFSEDDLRVVFWGLGLHLGIPMSQSKNGEFMAEVRDIGVKLYQPDTRAYRSAGRLRFHMDRCDILALLCVREPISGGTSRIVSSAMIHNAILERRPDLLEVLYRDFHFSRQGEEVAGEERWFPLPIYASMDGCFTSEFSQSFIDSAQRFPEVPRLSAQQREAIELVAALADEFSYDMQLQRGDIQLLNNHVTYHSRTDYQDHEEPERKRLLLRLWLCTPVSRPLPASHRTNWYSIAGGSVRGGVPPASGPHYSFDSWQAAGWPAASTRK